MGKFKNKIYRFMYGRYGSDTLNKVLLGVYLVLFILYAAIALFVKSLVLAILYNLLTLTLIVIIFWRMFSRNIPARRKENEKFCGFFKLRRNKFRDRKTHVYRKCPKCHAVLRLPKAKGKHSVVCPCCANRFEVKG